MSNSRIANRASDELSPRELELLSLVVTGATNQQIARELCISPNTVKTHLRNIFGKLGVESRTEATLHAIQHGLVPVEGQEHGAMPMQAPQELSAEEILERSWESSCAPRGVGLARSLALVAAALLAALVLLWPGPRPVVADPQDDSRLMDRPSISQAKGEEGALSRWRDRAQMPGPAGRFAQAELDGLIYVISGVGPEGPTDAVRVYDVTKDAWEYRSAKPTQAANVGAAVVDGRIYVPGGLGQDGRPIDRLEVYDPQEDTWAQGPSLPAALCAYAIVAYERGFYLMGGWDGNGYLDTVYYYDAVAQMWHLEAHLSSPRGFAAAALADGRIYLVGGYSGSSEYHTTESYQPELARQGQDPWRSHAPMRAGRAGHVVVPVLGHLYVLGGGWEHPFTANERYDVANDVWSTFDSPIVGEWRTLGASRIETGAGTFIYAIGGWNGDYMSSVKTYQAFYRIYLP
jgi:DNA-binding CsgD family transcriptional regulator